MIITLSNKDGRLILNYILKNNMRYILLFFFILTSCEDPRRKDANTFYLATLSEPTSLNYLSNMTNGGVSAIADYTMESLLSRDIDTYEWEPALAISFKISEDKSKYDFFLRKGVTFHNGEEFDAEDVKFSFDAIFDDKYRAVDVRPYYESIEKVEIIDKYHVRFHIKDRYFKNFDTAAGLTIFPKDFTENSTKKELNKKMVGTGPYKVEKFDRGNRITLVHNENWWGFKRNNNKDYRVRRISLKFVKEMNVSLEMFKKGDIDYLGLRPEQYVKQTDGEKWGEDLIKVKTTTKAPSGYNFIGWNFKHPFLKNKNVRRALALLLNRPLLNEKFRYNMYLMATGPVDVKSEFAHPQIAPVPFNPTLALNLLRREGWQDSDEDGVLDKVINGKKTNFSITILEPLEYFVKFLTVYQEEAKKIGVEIKIKLVEWNTFIKLMDEKKFDALRLAWQGGAVEPDLKQVWHSSSANGGSNFISYHNPEVDRLIDAYRVNFNKEKRKQMIQRADKLIADDFPYVFFFNNKYTLYGVNKKVVREKDSYTYSVGTSRWNLTKVVE